MTEYLLKHENLVLSIVREYLNENRYFMEEEIIPYIQVRLREHSVNLTHSGIRKILESLKQQKMILERSKLVRDEVLDNENRDRIYCFIQDYPGIYFNQIAKNLSLSNYILAWHLKMLMQFEFIRSKEIENHEAFFDENLPPGNDALYFVMSLEKSRAILDFMMDHPEGVTKTKLSRKLSMHPSTASKYLKKLENKSILLKKKLPRKTIYFLNEKLYHGLLNG